MLLLTLASPRVLPQAVHYLPTLGVVSFLQEARPANVISLSCNLPFAHCHSLTHSCLPTLFPPPQAAPCLPIPGVVSFLRDLLHASSSTGAAAGGAGAAAAGGKWHTLALSCAWDAIEQRPPVRGPMMGLVLEAAERELQAIRWHVALVRCVVTLCCRIVNCCGRDARGLMVGLVLEAAGRAFAAGTCRTRVKGVDGRAFTDTALNAAKRGLPWTSRACVGALKHECMQAVY